MGYDDEESMGRRQSVVWNPFSASPGRPIILVSEDDSSALSDPPSDEEDDGDTPPSSGIMKVDSHMADADADSNEDEGQLTPEESDEDVEIKIEREDAPLARPRKKVTRPVMEYTELKLTSTFNMSIKAEKEETRATESYQKRIAAEYPELDGVPTFVLEEIHRLQFEYARNPDAQQTIKEECNGHLKFGVAGQWLEVSRKAGCKRPKGIVYKEWCIVPLRQEQHYTAFKPYEPEPIVLPNPESECGQLEPDQLEPEQFEPDQPEPELEQERTKSLSSSSTLTALGESPEVSEGLRLEQPEPEPKQERSKSLSSISTLTVPEDGEESSKTPESLQMDGIMNDKTIA